MCTLLQWTTIVLDCVLHHIVLCTLLMVLNFLGPSLANVKVLVRMPKVVCPMQNHLYAFLNQIVEKSPKRVTQNHHYCILYSIKMTSWKEERFKTTRRTFLTSGEQSKTWLSLSFHVSNLLKFSKVTQSKIFQFWSIWNPLLSSFKSFVLEILNSILLPGTWPLYTGIIVVIICASSYLT